MEQSLTGPFGLEREMGYSRHEFFRLLPGALSQCFYSAAGDVISVTLTRGSVFIRLGTERERRLTEWVRFPILPVDIEFVGVDAAEQALFMKRLDLSYMKGLG